MKETIILSIALFLASAPSPDSKIISELSAGFLAPTTNRDMMVAESSPDGIANSDLFARATVLSVTADHPESQRTLML